MIRRASLGLLFALLAGSAALAQNGVGWLKAAQGLAPLWPGPQPKGEPVPPRPSPNPWRPRPVFTLPGAPKLDLHGDPLPSGAVARFGTVRLRHGTELQTMAFTHDGKFLCTTSIAGESVKLWDAATGKEVARLNSPVELVGLAKDGSVVVVGRNRVRVWLPATNTVRDLPEKTLPPESLPTALAVNPDCRSFALANNGRLFLLDLQTGKTIRELKLPGNPPGNPPAPPPPPPPGAALMPGNAPPANAPVQLLYSPDGRWLVGNAPGSGVWLWDLRTGKRIRTYHAAAGLADYAFSPDVTKLAVTGERLHLYGLDSDEEVDGFKGPEGETLVAPHFSANGKTLFALREDAGVLPVDAETGESKETLAAPEMNLHAPFALAPGGSMAAAVDATGGIRIWEPKTGRGPKVARLPPLTAPGITANGKSVSVLDQESKVHTFDLATGAPGKVVELPVEEGDVPVACDAASRRAAIRFCNLENPAVRFISTDTGKEISRFPLLRECDLLVVSFASANRDRAVVIKAEEATVVNPTTGKAVRSFNHSGKSPLGMISPDGRLVALGTPALSVWEVATGKKRLTLENVLNAQALTFSADSRTLAAWDQGGSVAVVDVRTGAVVRRLQVAADEEGLTLFALNRDGRRLAVGSPAGHVTVYDLTTGETLAPFGGHDGSVTGLVFTADGKRLVSTSEDGTALVWEVPDQALVVGTVESPVATGEEAFRLLGSADPAQAQRGMDYFYRHPAEAVKLAGERVPAPAATPPAKLAQLIADLSSSDFPTREAAVKAIEKLGGEARPLLREVVQKSDSAEARKLAGELLGKIDAPTPRADDLRILRAVEVMENLQTAESQAQLEKWSAGPAGHRLTVEAAAAIKRLKGTEK